MFKILKTEGKARRGEFSCAHGGTVQTPVFIAELRCIAAAFSPFA